MKTGESKRVLLSHEVTMDLVAQAQAGSQEAKQKLVEHNIGLINSVLRGFRNRGYEIDDLFQIGSIGLLKAIDKFDTTFKVKFSTYAVPMIMGEIKRFLRDDGLIKVSRSLKQTAAQTKNAREYLFKTMGREPTINEISEEIGIGYEDIVMALEASYHPEYLHRVIYQDDGAPLYLIDKIDANSDTDDETIVDNIMIKEVLSKLEERDRKIIILRYFKDKTQVDVAKMLGISQVQVSRIEKRVIIQIREFMVKA